VNAASPWEVEGGAYGGGGTGHVACGPDVRVGYGGLGGEVRYSGGRDGDRMGVAFDVGGAGESQRQSPVDCVGTTCAQYFNAGLATGGAALVGFDTPYFGLRFGGAYFTEPTASGLQVNPLPEGYLRFGQIDGGRFLLGFGSYDLPSYIRPGAYLGGYVPTGLGWQVGLHAGIHYLTQGTIAVRETLTIHAPLSEHLWLRTDLALVESEGEGGDFVVGVGGAL
jgi:hypothetical protein